MSMGVYQITLSPVRHATDPMPNTSPSHLHGAPPKAAPYRWIQIRPGNIPPCEAAPLLTALSLPRLPGLEEAEGPGDI